MTRDVVSLTIRDLSQFAKSLRGGLDQPPGHLQFLNMLARAAGYRNYQHLRALNRPEAPVDMRRVDRALRRFDAQGRFASWPSRIGQQHLCLWAIWAQLPARERMNEREISALIDTLSAFRDAARIRRTLVEMQLLERTRDGSVYARRERPVPPEARALIRAVMSRRTALAESG